MKLLTLETTDTASVVRGVGLAAMIGLTASILSNHYGAPAMLFALMIGMIFQFTSEDIHCSVGVNFAAKQLLRLGVGFMGASLSLASIQVLGFGPVIATLLLVLLTLAFGALISLCMGRKLAFGMLAGGAVGICGASAAMAIAAVLPKRQGREQEMLFVVVAVTTLSTIAMVVYPILFSSLGFSELESGFLIGATVHDVAQVVGAGYSISEEAGFVATFTKMLRVAMLPVVVFSTVLLFSANDAKRKLDIPWFLILFITLAVLANMKILPTSWIAAMGVIAKACLLVAIAALGMKTSLKSMLNINPKFALILGAETLFLLLAAIGYVQLVWRS